MAAQVLSGTGNVTYTNSTGQNVRVVINYLHNDSNVNPVNMTFQGVSVTIPKETKIGKSLAWEASGTQVGERGYFASGQTGNNTALPTEFAISNGETFSLSISGSATTQLRYNIIIIPEAG